MSFPNSTEQFFTDQPQRLGSSLTSRVNQSICTLDDLLDISRQRLQELKDSETIDPDEDEDQAELR